MKKQITQIVAIVGLLLCGASSQAQVLMSSSFTYSQNFDSLPTQAGTVMTSNVWANNTTLPGWYANSVLSPTIFGVGGQCTNILAQSGGSSTSGFYSFGTNGVNVVTDRALGSLMGNTFSASGTPAIAYGVRFTNNTATAMSNFVVTYTGEEWRVNGNVLAQTLAFAYRIDSSSITNADPSSVATWTAVTALNFTTPITAGTSSLDGNASTNRTVLSAALTGVLVLPGQEVFIRWLDANDSGNDHALAIDDLTVSYTNVVASASGPSFTVNPSSLTVKAGNQVIGSATVAGTQPIGYSWYTIQSGATNFIGTQNPQLLYAYAATNQTGSQYFVVASNSVNMATSSVATLTVTSAVPITTTVSYLRTLKNASYALTDMTNLYTIEGVVFTPNLITGPLQSYFIWDGTGGIDVFNRDGAFTMPAIGQKVRVTGPIFNFNGLLELNVTNANPTHSVVLVGDPTNALPTPASFDFATAGNPVTMESGVEGSLVYVTNVFLGYTNSVYFSAGTSIFMTNMTGKTFNLGIPSDTSGDMINKTLQTPPFATNVIGVVSQNSGLSVPTNGYSIVCFAYTNIGWATSVAVSTPINLAINQRTNSVISWPVNLFSLQSSTNVAGPYVTIPGASTPYTNDTTTNAMQFFKLIY